MYYDFPKPVLVVKNGNRMYSHPFLEGKLNMQGLTKAWTLASLSL